MPPMRKMSAQPTGTPPSDESPSSAPSDCIFPVIFVLSKAVVAVIAVMFFTVVLLSVILFPRCFILETPLPPDAAQPASRPLCDDTPGHGLVGALMAFVTLGVFVMYFLFYLIGLAIVVWHVLDWFNLRLPAKVRKQLMDRPGPVLPLVGCPRRGYRCGGKGSSQGRDFMRPDRPDWVARSERSDFYKISLTVAADGGGGASWVSVQEARPAISLFSISLIKFSPPCNDEIY
ncbi:hypothetical protein ACJRO7_032926 [Eucalyptus globulus]|uniref:Uncharacterized protein n=1 Tax=Eucalyptus globulus TaxID=34317 RepID=A0ABD3JMR9_EUCGL